MLSLKRAFDKEESGLGCGSAPPRLLALINHISPSEATSDLTGLRFRGPSKADRGWLAFQRLLGLHLFARGLKIEAGRAVLFARPSAAWKNSPSCLVPVKCRKVRVTGGPERA